MQKCYCKNTNQNQYSTQQYSKKLIKKSTGVLNWLKTQPSCPPCWSHTIKTKVKLKNGKTQLS